MACASTIKSQRQRCIDCPPARPEGFSKESGAIQETFRRECEEFSCDKALRPAAQIPEGFEKPRETLRKHSGKIRKALVRRAYRPFSE